MKLPPLRVSGKSVASGLMFSVFSMQCLSSSCSGLVIHLDSSLWLIALCPFVLVSV